MKIQSKDTGAKFETRVSSLQNVNGSDLRLEVFVAGKWRHVHTFLIEGEIHCSADIYELDAKLNGLLVERSQEVENWISMKIENKKKKMHDFTADGFTNFK